MQVTAIISNFNGARFLPRLIDSLLTQEGVELEIVVVDRQSTDGSAAILARHPEIRVISEPPETGLVAGYHRGVASACSELLFFSNEDMWFEPGCLAQLAAGIDLAGRIAATDGWHFGYDHDAFLHGATRFQKVPWAINSPYPRRSADFEVRLPAGTEVPFPCAGAFLMHRRVYDELGGWDTGFFLDHEDIDLFIRAWQRGWKTASVPGARIHHAINASNNQSLSRLNLSVSERRYISQRSNLSVIALKYFSLRALPMASLVWPAVFLNNLKSRRWASIRRDFQVLAEIRRRAPEALRFRRSNRDWNRDHPGEEFFLEPRFQRSETSESSMRSGSAA
jgi:GT2 family glycosyltransferase